ncbi:MAG: flavin reductase family protein [Phycisphaerales bacterium]|nr:flavin reductase family protein [Phycisphaerales bacterium]
MLIDLASAGSSWRDVYRLCVSFIHPRPIALVSSRSGDGALNLAPFSFYNMVCANPPVVMISTGLHRDRRPKDTCTNIVETREFVIATVVPQIAAQMAACAAELPRGGSEFDFSGLTPRPAARVKAMCVAESPVNIECTLRDVITIGEGPGSARMILGNIAAIHVADELIGPDGTCDPHRLQTVGRLGGKWYSNVADPYELEIPPVPGA